MSNKVKIKVRNIKLCCSNCKNRNNGFCTVTNNKVWKYDKSCPKFIDKNSKIIKYFGKDVYDAAMEFLNKENNNDDSRFYGQEESGVNNSDK